MPAAPHEVSVRPDGSTQILSTDSNLQGCPTLSSFGRRSAPGNLPVGGAQAACPEHAAYRCCQQDVDRWCKEVLSKKKKKAINLKIEIKKILKKF